MRKSNPNGLYGQPVETPVILRPWAKEGSRGYVARVFFATELSEDYRKAMAAYIAESWRTAIHSKYTEGFIVPIGENYAQLGNDRKTVWDIYRHSNGLDFCVTQRSGKNPSVPPKAFFDAVAGVKAASQPKAEKAAAAPKFPF